MNKHKFIVSTLILTAAAKWSKYVEAAEEKRRDERKTAEARRREEHYAALEKRHREEQEREERKRLELEQEYVDGPWEFEFVLTDEEKRKRILDYVKPRFDGMAGTVVQYGYLNLAYGVTDKAGTVFVTQSYYMPDGIKRCDDYDDHDFVILTGKTAFGAGWKDRHSSGQEIGPSTIEMPRWAEPFREIVGQALAVYMDYKEKRLFEAKCKEQDSDFDLSKLRRQLLRELPGYPSN